MRFIQTQFNKIMQNLSLGIVILVVLFIYLLPMLGALNVAFKSSTEFYRNPSGLFEALTFVNFQNALGEAKFFTYFFKNSTNRAAFAMISLPQFSS